MEPSIVIDTNVLVAARRSSRGASARLVSLIGKGFFDLHLSTALLLEFEEVLYRLHAELGLRPAQTDAFLDALAYAGIPQRISFRWRGYTRDPKDAMVLELAVAAGCDYLVTYNKRDFPEVETLFGIKVVNALEFLKIIDAL